MDIRPPTFRSIRLVSDTGYSVTIAENANDYCLDENGLDLGVVGGTLNTTQYIDLIGKHVDSVVLSPRDISIVGWIIGTSEAEIQSRKVLLNRSINPKYKVSLEYNDYAISFYPDNSIQYSTTYSENNEYMCKFQIQGTAPMPLFTLIDLIEYRQTVDMTPLFKYPFSIPKDRGIMFAVLSFESISNMPNRGDVESGFIIHFRVQEEFEGQVVNPIVRNATSGEEIKLSYTMRVGEEIEICTVLGEQYVTLFSEDGSETDGMKYVTFDSDLDMVLKLGLNSIEFDADENGDVLRGEVYFTPRFLEVQGR